MKNVEIMQFFESKNYIDQSFPNFLFWKHTLFFLMFNNLLVEVSIIRVVHYDAGYRKKYQRELD